MDPDETLARLQQMAESENYATGPGNDEGWSREYANSRCQLYAELFEALDGWMTRGGMAPTAWSMIRLPEPPEPWHGKAIS